MRVLTRPAGMAIGVAMALGVTTAVPVAEALAPERMWHDPTGG